MTATIFLTIIWFAFIVYLYRNVKEEMIYKKTNKWKH